MIFMTIQEYVLNVLKNDRLEFSVITIFPFKQQKPPNLHRSLDRRDWNCSYYDETVGVISDHENDEDTVIKHSKIIEKEDHI